MTFTRGTMSFQVKPSPPTAALPPVLNPTRNARRRRETGPFQTAAVLTFLTQHTPFLDRMISRVLCLSQYQTLRDRS